ncbi:hypothetical protein NNA36_19340 [Shimia sp. CNT1-13L.2]|uniref:hypothetical protein n=1 Tax=Shimia sp. CNT1-13L.2 TaxID=2959663 RepID=UPI0020CB77C8|nr:hypothetical protein [Shimia sp. CNT1-13L.2]MCP9484122.1 hypothetical protein [Shimia sp. CNT1-13L.2]
MKNLFRSTLIATIAAVSMSAAASAADMKGEVDGIPATIVKKGGATVVMLDVKHGKKRDVRIEQAVRAAKEITGCKATHVGGTIFEFQGRSERPAMVQVKLKC